MTNSTSISTSQLISIATLDRATVISGAGCTCSGDYNADLVNYYLNCQTQTFCLKVLARRQSMNDMTTSRIILRTNQNGITPVTYGSSTLTKNKWVAIQQQVDGFCDGVEVIIYK